MAAIIGHILPLGLGVALSSVPIVVMVLILLSPRGRWSSLTYLIGALIGLVGLTSLFSAIATLLPPPPPSEKSPLFGTIELLIGVALLILAFIRWRRARHAEHSTASGTPKWMSKVTELGPIPSFGLGFILMLRPKNLLFTLAAGVAVGAGGPSFAEAAVAIAIFVVIGISTLAAPIIFTFADPKRMRKPLEETRVWIEHNSGAVTTVVVLVLGTVVIGSGLAHY
jgi:MFS family permease